MQPPPCLTPGEPMNHCARGVYALEINTTTDLTGPWAGWRLRGNVLVSPDRDRITPERLRGLLFVESLNKKKRLHGDGAKQNLSVTLVAQRPKDGGENQGDRDPLTDVFHG